MDEALGRTQMSPKNPRARLVMRLLFLAHPSWPDWRIYNATSHGVKSWNEHHHQYHNNHHQLRQSKGGQLPQDAGISSPSGQGCKYSHLDIRGHFLLCPCLQVTGLLYFIILQLFHTTADQSPHYNQLLWYSRKDRTIQHVVLRASIEGMYYLLPVE